MVVSLVCGTGEEITASEVGAAIGRMKSSKSAGLSGIVADMMKVAGEVGKKWITDAWLIQGHEIDGICFESFGKSH